MNALDRYFRDNLEHSLLHRLPYGATSSLCGMFDVAMVDQLFFDSVRFAGADKCAPCFKDVEFTDVHTSHCCKKHGCKYDSEYCTITRGVAKQEYPCEWCALADEEMQERGEVWQYGIVSADYGPENDFDSYDGYGISVLAPDKKKPRLREGVVVVRRRVSTWEEVER
jgi:hypothetical protein